MSKKAPVKVSPKTWAMRLGSFVQWFRKLGWWARVIAPAIPLLLVGAIGGLHIGDNHTKTPSNVIDQVIDKPFWTAPPQFMPSAEASWERDKPVVVVNKGEPSVVSATQLAEHAAAYEGEDVMLVGLVVENSSLQIPGFAHHGHGVGDELLVVGEDNTVTYLGLNTKRHLKRKLEGEVVLVVGRVAALGVARLLNGLLVRAAYFLASGGGQLISAPTFIARHEDLRGLAQVIRVRVLEARGASIAQIRPCRRIYVPGH